MSEIVLNDEEIKVKRDKERLANEWLREAEDTRAILQTYGGRAFFWRLLAECGLYKDDFHGEQTHKSSHSSGKRSVGIWILENIFTIDENAYTLMRNEAMVRAKEARAQEQKQEAEQA